MADRYVRSTDGSDADNGTTWALAKATLAGVAAIDTAGDRLFVSQVHSESTSAAVTIALAGSLGSPTRVICGNDAAEPPTAVAATAVVATGASYSITITGNFYIYGVEFSSGASLSVAAASWSRQLFENCNLTLNNTSGASALTIGEPNAAYPQMASFINCDFRFGRADGQIISLIARTEILGGTVTSSTSFTAAVFSVFTASGEGPGKVEIDGVDLSTLASSVSIFSIPTGTGANGVAVIRNCKLPASWAGSLASGSWTWPGHRFEMYNCDSADTNYRLWVEEYAGSIKSETTIVRTGGASDGTTSLAWKMATFSGAQYPLHPLKSPEIVQWNETTGSSVTATVEIVHDSQGAGSGSKFQDDEVWVEVMYLGTSGYPLGSRITDCKADVLATAANQADSSETWTTTGLTTPVKQALSVTFTPQEKGFIHARVVMAKASKTCYVCPKLTVA